VLWPDNCYQAKHKAHCDVICCEDRDRNTPLTNIEFVDRGSVSPLSAQHLPEGTFHGVRLCDSGEYCVSTTLLWEPNRRSKGSHECSRALAISWETDRLWAVNCCPIRVVTYLMRGFTSPRTW